MAKLQSSVRWVDNPVKIVAFIVMPDNSCYLVVWFLFSTRYAKVTASEWLFIDMISGDDESREHFGETAPQLISVSIRKYLNPLKVHVWFNLFPPSLCLPFFVLGFDLQQPSAEYTHPEANNWPFGFFLNIRFFITKCQPLQLVSMEN